MVDQVRVITGLLEQATERVVAAISVNITAELIENTPVDLGWARANWVPAIGAPPEDPAPGPNDIAPISAQVNRQQAEIATVATSYTLNRGAVFVTNNVPYITLLNQGSSTQAPSGFVQASIARGIARLGDRIPR